MLKDVKNEYLKKYKKMNEKVNALYKDVRDIKWVICNIKNNLDNLDNFLYGETKTIEKLDYSNITTEKEKTNLVEETNLNKIIKEYVIDCKQLEQELKKALEKVQNITEEKIKEELNNLEF